MKKCLILANGEIPKKAEILFLQKHGYETLICADGGANSAYKLNLIPDYIVGDLDSIKQKTLDYYKKKSKVIKYTRQNDTDVEKAIKLAIKLKFDEVILLGATGDRLDHTFCNLGITLKFNPKIDVSILHKKSFLKVYSGKVRLTTNPYEVISIYAFDNRTTISSKGLKYSLKSSKLPFGEKESTSNLAIGSSIELDINNGKVFVIREFNELRKNGYFG